MLSWPLCTSFPVINLPLPLLPFYSPSTIHAQLKFSNRLLTPKRQFDIYNGFHSRLSSPKDHSSSCSSSFIHTLFPSFTLIHFFVSSPFAHYLYFSEISLLNHIRPLMFFSSCTFTFCLSTRTPLLVSFSVSTEGYMNAPSSSCIFDRTNSADIFCLVRGPRLHYAYIDLWLPCESRHRRQTVKVSYVLLLFQWRSAFTTHTISWLLLSPLVAMCA